MGKYDRYICSKLFKREMLPGPTPEQRDRLAAEGLRIRLEHVLWIDSDIIPGGYYGESTWVWPQSYPHQISPEELAKRTTAINPMIPHDHGFPELLSWWGTDPDNTSDTNGMGLLLEDEEIPLERSFVAYIPAGMKHMPTHPPNSRISARPVCHWTSGPGGVYDREKEADGAKSGRQSEAVPAVIKKTGPFKNAKYIVYDYKENVKRPPYMHETDPRYTRPIAYIDQSIIPDAEFGCDTMWFLPGDRSGGGQLIMDAHTLSHGTSLTFTSLNYEDITDLCAEVELWIGGEKHIVTRSFGAYIPPNVEQGPLIIRNIKKQVFFMMSQPIGEGIKKYRGGR